MRKYALALKENETVLEIEQYGEVVCVRTDKGAYESRTAIIASGKRSRELLVPGEKEFKNKGISYCATCDGPIFSGKEVAVIGGGNSALDAALQLMNIARHTYVININPQLAGDAIMREKVESSPNVTVLNNARITAVMGDKMVSGIKITRQEKEEALAVEGVFVEIGLKPNSEFAKDIVLNERREIKVNAYNETNLAGIFAAGDVTDVPQKQIVIAAGEGSKAALSAFRYLAQHKF